MALTLLLALKIAVNRNCPAEEIEPHLEKRSVIKIGCPEQQSPGQTVVTRKNIPQPYKAIQLTEGPKENNLPIMYHLL